MSEPSSAPYNAQFTAQYHQQPPQSRDATATARFYQVPAETSSRILVPNSSPLGPDHNYNPYQQQYAPHHHQQLPPPPYNSSPYNRGMQQQHQQFPQQYHHQLNYNPSPFFRDDPLTASSGFSFPQHQRQQNNGRPISEVDGAEFDPPRKRLNRGPQPPTSPDDPLNIIDSPGSPQMQRLQRRRLVSNASSDESYGNHPVSGGSDDPRFTRFKVTMPTHPAYMIKEAWNQSGGDVRRATDMLSDPNWRPPAPTQREHVETGRVREVEEAHKASRAAAREKAKKSSIYANRVVLEPRVQKATTPPPTKIDLTETPGSPPLRQARRRRLKRVMDSDSEADYQESEPESRSSPPVTVANNHRSRALEFFNTAGIESLQELTGRQCCTC